MSRLRLVTGGESHGPAVLAVLDGLPHGLPLEAADLDRVLRRRQLGYGRGPRQAIESDRVELLGGVRHGRTLGSPLALLVRNRDWENWREEMSPAPPPEGWEAARPMRAPRPGHADLAGALKLLATDLRDVSERASARETAARVAAGAACLRLLAELGVEVRGHVRRVGETGLPEGREVVWEEIAGLPDEPEGFPCVDEAQERRMREAVDRAREAGDSLGGVFEVVARGVPPGLGSHAQWDRRLDGRLLQAVGSIQGVKAAEIGQGVRAAGLPGSRAHDEIVKEGGDLRRPTNRAGGIEGGISNGEEVRVRGHMKPLATLREPLASVDLGTGEGAPATVERSDVCSVAAASVVGEAVVGYVLADALLEKLGGDSLEELRASLTSYRRLLAERFGAGGPKEETDAR